MPPAVTSPVSRRTRRAARGPCQPRSARWRSSRASQGRSWVPLSAKVAGGSRGCLGEQQGAAVHAVARPGPAGAAQEDRAADEARGEPSAGRAADRDGAAAHPVAGPVADAARDQDGAARHAVRVAGQRSAEEGAGIARDGDQPVAHRRPGEVAGVAGERDPAAADAEAEIGAGVAPDVEPAQRHAGAQPVEAARRRPRRRRSGSSPARTPNSSPSGTWRLPTRSGIAASRALRLAGERRREHARHVDRAAPDRP